MGLNILDQNLVKILDRGIDDVNRVAGMIVQVEQKFVKDGLGLKNGVLAAEQKLSKLTCKNDLELFGQVDTRRLECVEDCLKADLIHQVVSYVSFAFK